MNIPVTVNQKQLLDILLNVAIARPVFIWGAPGIGKSSIVERFADSLGLSCVSLLGSQLAPEDIIGVPQIIEGKSVFCPPRMIARDEPYCLFLDELNACSQEVQKAFYSLIHDRRIGEYFLPEGSIIIGAGNRAQDNAIVKQMSSALVNRMFHVELIASHRDWLAWAAEFGIHPLILEYIGLRPDHLWHQPPKTEEPFSTPRSWHMLSDALHSYGDAITDAELEILASGCLSAHHATQFRAFVKQIRSRYALSAIIDGKQKWPSAAEDRDTLYFLAQSFKAQLVKELPPLKNNQSAATQDLAHKAKALIKDLANISLEIAQMAVSPESNNTLPDWFIVEVIRDLPRLVAKR
ncbi:MAG: MoxR family ATPase [Deferribacteraceae bacterium]|jgi:MoxR-like ATPase|nr:MoxR family ATPase [Deferribacteraceae bacterium]